MISIISILHHLLEISISIKRSDLIDKISMCLRDFHPKNPVLNLSIIFCFFCAKKYDYLWERMMLCIKNQSFRSSLYVFYLYAAFFTLFSDDVFKYYRFETEFWDNSSAGKKN